MNQHYGHEVREACWKRRQGYVVHSKRKATVAHSCRTFVLPIQPLPAKLEQIASHVVTEGGDLIKLVLTNFLNGWMCVLCTAARGTGKSSQCS